MLKCKVFFALKKEWRLGILLILCCSIFKIAYVNEGISVVYAASPVISETPDISIFEQYKKAMEKNTLAELPDNYIDSSIIEEQLKYVDAIKNLNPLEFQYYKNIYGMLNNNPYREPTFSEADKKALLYYYNADLIQSGNLTNYHEENYIYANGESEKNVYNGVIGYAINDFDGDLKPELAIFKITTNVLSENYPKSIVLDIVKLNNGVPYLLDKRVLMSEDFDAETIELNISIKKYNDRYRIYLEYFEKRVADSSVMNKFLAIDVHDSIHIVAEANYNGVEDGYYYYDDNYDFTNIVLDAGIDVHDNVDIINNSFLNNDSNAKPITTMYRVNESLRDGYLARYVEDYYDDFIKYGFLKIRYGYTNIMMR